MYRQEWIFTTRSEFVPPGVDLYHQKWICTTGSGFVPPGMDLYHREWICTTGSGFVPPGVDLYHQEWICTTRNGWTAVRNIPNGGWTATNHYKSHLQGEEVKGTAVGEWRTVVLSQLSITDYRDNL